MTESQRHLYSQAVQRSRQDLPSLIGQSASTAVGCGRGLTQGFPPPPGPSGDVSKSISAIMELRKIAMHPLLVRHRYDDSCLHCMSREILQDPSHQNADPALVYEDMSVMSDFELHNLCLESKVRFFNESFVVVYHCLLSCCCFLFVLRL